MSEFKPLSLEDFDLSPKEMKAIVDGAQKFLPPESESPVESEDRDDEPTA